jgi:hypothetical protein
MKSRRKQGSVCVAARGAGCHQADRREYASAADLERGEVGHGWFAGEAATSEASVRLFSSFFADRLKVQLRDQGARHDLVDAVFSLGGQDDLLLVVRRVEALGKFLDTDDGKNLLAGTKRASNILAIEEKKDKRTFDGAPDAGLTSCLRKRRSRRRSIRSRARPAPPCRGRFRHRDECDGKAASGSRCVL